MKNKPLQKALLTVLFVALLVGTHKLSTILSDTQPQNRTHFQTDPAASEEPSFSALYNWSYRGSNLIAYEYTIRFVFLRKAIEEAISSMGIIVDEAFENEAERQRHLGLPFSRPGFMKEVYHLIYSRSNYELKRIHEGFQFFFKEYQLTQLEKIDLLTTFVQMIPYGIPDIQAGVFPPEVSVAYQFGDCDTKSLLLLVLLEQIDVDSIILLSSVYRHAMLGIALAASGDYLALNGKRYYFLETTGKGWPIGVIPPENNNIKFWLPIDPR